MSVYEGKNDTDYIVDRRRMDLGIIGSGKLPVYYQILSYREPIVERTVKITHFSHS